MLDETQSIAGICEVHRHVAHGDSDAEPALLIELPHGATRHAHYEAVRRRMQGQLPDELEAFFFVNTDVGTPECAQHVGAMLAERGLSTVILRSLLPRTLIDCNRVVAAAPDGTATTMTAAIPDYVENAADRQLLIDMHSAYHRTVGAAYQALFANGGTKLALQLHSYAPKSIQVDNIDDGIVAALRHAYQAEQYANWKDRPMVELITQTVDGLCLSPPAAVSGIKQAFAASGIEVMENQTYHLHSETWGYRYAAEHPGKVLCIELNRSLLATPFTPFAEMTIGDAESRRLAAPIAQACTNFLNDRPD